MHLVPKSIAYKQSLAHNIFGINDLKVDATISEAHILGQNHFTQKIRYNGALARDWY